jgi:SDR family mycofactocin-dependent oxidoreductase
MEVTELTKSLAGRVAMITGAARGQGRAHAVRLAGDGADIIALDIAEQIETVPYPMATTDDLHRTGKEVEALGRRVVTVRADVRDFPALSHSVNAAVAKLGRLDFVVANAAIAPHSADESDPVAVFLDTIMTNLVGVRHTVHAAVEHLLAHGTGGAIVLIGSTQGLTGRGGNGSGAMDGYVASKHGVVGLMRTYANWLAPHRIRVNAVHPTGVATPMVINDAMRDFIAATPSAEAAVTNLLPVQMVDVSDVSAAVAWLISDEARYVTGINLPVDAGFTAK